jgi:hypothetical protein
MYCFVYIFYINFMKNIYFVLCRNPKNSCTFVKKIILSLIYKFYENIFF